MTYKADGEVVGTVTVEHGKVATASAIPEKEGYTGEWSEKIDAITGDVTVEAVYTKLPDEDKEEDSASTPNDDGESEEDSASTPDDDQNSETELPTTDDSEAAPSLPQTDDDGDSASKPSEDKNNSDVSIPSAEKDTESPKTGDNTNLWLLIAFVFVSGGITRSIFGKKNLKTK